MENPSAIMRILLNHDGSMTKALESLLITPVVIQIISETELETSPVHLIESPVIRRETVLISGSQKLVYAVSY